MSFLISLSILTDWKRDNYDLIFVIVNRLTKIVYYKSVKIIINIPTHAKVIIDVVVKYYGLLNLIIIDKNLLFISKFWLLL